MLELKLRPSKEQDLSTSSEAVRPQESFMGTPLAYYAAQEK